MSAAGDRVYIIDNGKAYSDRQIWFIAVPSGRSQELEKALNENNEARNPNPYGTWSVIAVVTVEEWRGKGPPMTLQAALEQLNEDTSMWKDMES